MIIYDKEIDWRLSFISAGGNYNSGIIFSHGYSFTLPVLNAENLNPMHEDLNTEKS